MNRLKTQSPEDVLERVRSDVIEARDHFEIYRTYKHIRSRAHYREVLHVYGFFSHSLRAHFAAIFAALGRVFDESEKSVGIQTLLNVAPHLRSVELRTQQRADKLWSTARHIRHQFVAHQYARSSVQETFKQAANR